MARTFASGDKVLMSAGVAANITTAWSVAAICQLASGRDGAFRSLFLATTTAGLGDGYYAEWTSVNKMSVGHGGATTPVSTTTTTSSDGWCLHVVTKAAGTTTPTYHRYKYSTNVFVTAEAMDRTLVNAGGTPDGIEICGGLAGSGDNFAGETAVVAVWDRALATVEVQNLPFTLQSWLTSNPKGLWTFEQGATTHKILDWTGGGANESSLTGTSVATAAVPLFNFSDGPWPVTHAAAGTSISLNAPAGALVLAGDAPSLTYGGQVTAPAGTLTLAGDAPTLKNAVTAPAGALVLAGDAPVIQLGPTAPAGALVLGATAPSVTYSGQVTAPAGALVLAGDAATVDVGSPAAALENPAVGGWTPYYH